MQTAKWRPQGHWETAPYQSGATSQTCLLTGRVDQCTKHNWQFIDMKLVSSNTSLVPIGKLEGVPLSSMGKKSLWCVVF